MPLCTARYIQIIPVYKYRTWDFYYKLSGMTQLAFYPEQYSSNGSTMPYAIAAGGVVYKKVGSDFVYMILGRHQDSTITYHLPKGTVRVDETLESAAVREIAEEAGVRVTLHTYLGATTNRYSFNGKDFDKTVHIFAAEYVDEAGDMDNEHDTREWYGYDEALDKLNQERKNEGHFLVRCKEYLDGQAS